MSNNPSIEAGTNGALTDASNERINATQYIRRVLPYLRPYLRLVVCSVILTLLASGLGMLKPWPFKLIVDNVLADTPLPPAIAPFLSFMGTGQANLLIAIVLGALALTLSLMSISIFTEYVHTKLQQYLMLDFRGDLFRHAQYQSLSFHDQQRSGDLLFAINSQAGAAADLAMSLQPIVQNGLMVIGMAAITYALDHQLALIAVTVVPFLYYTVGWYARHMEHRTHAVRKMEGESMSIISEAIGMIRVIVAFGREAYEYGRFRKQGEEAVDARIDLTVRQSIFSSVVSLTTTLGTTMVFGYGAFRIIQGHLTLGDLIVILTYVGSVYGPLKAISQSIGTFQERFASLKIAFALLDEDPAVADRPNAVPLEDVRGDVEFENVSFSYTGRSRTLSDITVRARAGQIIGLVGQTGAGKSTLVSLLPRFYDVDEGRILIDGVDIRDVTLQSLRSNISVVLQDPLLFSGTIYDNIRYGRLEATRDEVIAAARAANAHDFISRLPDQYETRIGERGARLSGGERQRVSIARAFLKDAPIMILDEPTSSVDSRTESVILDALDRLMEGRTTFVIAHRLATLRRADLILVVQEGRIVERGTSKELIRHDGIYKELRDIQAGVHETSAKSVA